jgi:Flp pilus assembly protein TadG
MSRSFHSIWADTRGNSFIELALVSPLLVALLIGTIDISRAVSAKLQIDQAAQRAIEWVQRSDFQDSDKTTVRADAAAAANVATSAVTVDNWLECDGVRQSNFDGACSDTQVSAKYVQVTISKSFTPIFGTRYFPGANSNGTVTLTSVAGIRAQ